MSCFNCIEVDSTRYVKDHKDPIMPALRAKLVSHLYGANTSQHPEMYWKALCCTIYSKGQASCSPALPTAVGAEPKRSIDSTQDQAAQIPPTFLACASALAARHRAIDPSNLITAPPHRYRHRDPPHKAPHKLPPTAHP